MNILVTSHAHLSDSLVETFRMFSSNCPCIHSVCLGDTGIDAYREKLDAKIETLLKQGNLLIMSDLLGGTPYNEAYLHAMRHPGEIRLVAGVNLPMLVEAGVFAMTTDDLDAVYEIALSSGATGVVGADTDKDEYVLEEEELF